MKRRASSEPIAIVGIGCRFPGGANDPASFWKLLCDGVDAITEIPPDRWSLAAHFSAEPGAPGKTRARHGGFIEGIDRFDPGFFGLSPREAPLMDPQHRLLLEVAWEAIEDGGQTPDLAHGSRTGVFVGLSTNDYSLIQNAPGAADTLQPYSATGVAPSIAPNRISHCFNFRGPSLAIDTACSSSLVAVHLACRSLRAGECDSAIVAGVNALLLPSAFIAFSAMSMLSPEGRCKAFAATANGFVRGEGAGAVVLKPLATALAARDPIYAIIRGTAMNQDGRTPGMTMPSQAAQAALIRAACRDGRVRPADVRYVEAHGTGTPIGDPIETAALSAALCRGRREPCLIGSVKTNIGHLEAGAGIAGLIKLALALKHRVIPPNLHFREPNPQIDFARLKLRVPTRLTPFPAPRIGGVNSFGFGGTNAHAVLEAAPAPRPARSRQTPRAFLLPVSARSSEALLTQIADWRAFLPGASAALHDIAHTAGTRRLHHPHRAFAVGRTARELAESFSAEAPPTTDHRIVFVFSGQGAQWPRMGCALFESEPVFRDKLRECDALLRRLGGWSLLDELAARRSRLDDTAIAQPAIFSIQVALAALWKSWGIQPAAVVGHSVGEVAAAHEAGALSLREAIRVIFHRGRCMDLAPATGRMLAVGMSADELPSLNGALDRIALAAVNSPSSITLAGDRRALREVARELEACGVFHREVPVRYAFHSPQMDPVRAELLRALRSLRPQAARIPIFSTVTGAVARGEDFGADYWWLNVRETVRFRDAVQALRDAGHAIFMELNAHPVLAPSLRECATTLALPSLRRGADESTTMLSSLGQLYASGLPVDWRALYPSGEFVPLPRHPWQRAAHWHESERSRHRRLDAPDHPLLTERLLTPDPRWESKIHRQAHPFFIDHRVGEHVVLPAAACAEMALAMTHAASREDQLVLEDVEFQKLVFLPENGPATLHASVSDGGFLICGRSGDSWITHASGRCRPASTPAQTIDRSALIARCPREISIATFYDYLAGIGLPYGPAFRSVREIRCGESEALGRIQLVDSLSSDGYLAHPALLDACFQMLAAPLLARRGDVAHGVYSPWKIARLRLFAPAARAAWVHVHLRGTGSRTIDADITAFDDSGAVIFTVEGFTVRLIESTERTAEHLLFEPQWRAAPLASAPATPHGPWLIFDDLRHTGRRLAARLRHRGERCEIARADQPLVGFRGVLDFRSLDATTSDLEKARALTCDAPLQLIQTAAQHERPPQIWFITSNVQHRSPSVVSAPLWGLGRVAMAEHRALRVRLVDLSGAPGELDALCDELRADSDEAEIALRGRSRFVLRIAPATPPARPARSAREHPCRLAITRPGVLENLAFEPQARRAPGPGEVEIEVTSAGLNFRDVMKSLGVYPNDDTRLGDECAGRITALGSGVRGLRVGDEVMALASGCFGPFVTTPAAGVVRKPAHLSMSEAATVPVAFLTAWHALIQLGQMKRGERVLIHAAAGGVGLAAVQLAKAARTEIFATAGSGKKRAFLRKLGVEHVMDSRSLAFADEVMRITAGRGADLVLNSLAGEAFERSLALLADGGRFLEIGKRDIYEGTRIGLHAFRKNAAFFSIDLAATLVGPTLRDGLLRLKRQFDRRVLAPLPVNTRPLSRAVDAFRQMARAQHIGKLALTMDRARVPLAVPAQLRFSSEATYLITGGTGGVGLALAEWLIACGARHLVLTNRSGDASAIRGLQTRGARVFVEKCDASSEADVATLLARIATTLPPLRGVFHLAATMDDGVLAQLTPERFRAVFAPKADGAWHLHRLTRALPLDHFVLFSSVSSLFGNPGQGNYAAANAFLDALAHHRRACGLPALVVNWGPFAEVGYLARHGDVTEHLARLGWQPLTPREAMRALETLLLRDAAHGVVARCDWSRLPEAPRYRELASTRTDDSGSASNLRGMLRDAAPPARAALMENFLREQIGQVLRTPPAKLENDRSLNDLGLDSLMAVELLNRVEAQLGIAVPTAQLMGGPTLNQLVAILLGLLPGEASAVPAAATAPARDLRADTRLDSAIRFDAPPHTGHPRAILLTDAASLSGVFLLRELLAQTEADIFCLSPAADVDRARAAIEQAFHRHCPGAQLAADRVAMVCGSLSKPRLGLPPARFQNLARTLDAIFHNAAQVNHVASYEQLRPANVLGTHEIIRLAATGARKPLHYISSISVFAAAESAGPVPESDPLSRPDELAMAYAETRWVAEQSLLAARGHGLPVSIHRPGYLTGDSATGALTLDDVLWRFVKACLALGAGPAMELPTCMTPADHFARAVVALAMQRESATWHLASPGAPTLRGLLAAAKRAGHPVRIVAKAAWEKSISAESRAGNPLAPYLLFYPARKQLELRKSQPFAGIDCRRTIAALAELGIDWPPIDDALLARYFRHLAAAEPALAGT